MSNSKHQSLKQRILDFLRDNDKKTFHPNHLAKLLSLDDNEFHGYHNLVNEMKASGEVAEAKEGRIRHRRNAKPAATDEIVGTLQVTRKGDGFLRVDGDEEYYVAPGHVPPALHGDRVAAKITKKANPRRDQLAEAKVLRVLERRRDSTVGTFEMGRSSGWVTPDDNHLPASIYVPQKEWNGAKPGQKVVVSLDDWSAEHSYPEGRILSILGNASDPGIDVLALAMAYGAPGEFPKEVEAEASNISISIPKEELQRRRDLRNETIYTIDPADAKDFDDAIHVKKLSNGNLEVGVHIADVSHYVEPETQLDAEAYERGTSTYLVDRTIPMLPETLSNGVCSLRPREDKLAYSCILEVTPEGTVVRANVEETVIHSNERFSYEEAQAILDGDNHRLAEDLRRAGSLARKLIKRRMAEGAIDFDVPEVKVILDDKGEPVDVVRKERTLANRLIEEFMLLANRAVASMGHQWKKPFVYRIHDLPDQERIEKLSDFVRQFGLKLSLSNGTVERGDLNQLLKEAKKLPAAPVIEQAAIRSMAKARYSPDNIGHFGLGFEDYTHFTSPIRRYPDLIVHRLLKRYLNGNSGVDKDTLAEQCRHTSDREKEATEAERESVKLKQVEYAAKHVGDTFDGVVSSATKFGVFVEMVPLLVDGLVHVRDMQSDYWEFDPDLYALVGRRSGRRIRTGDTCRVRIVSADPESRQVDLVFETLPSKKR